MRGWYKWYSTADSKKSHIWSHQDVDGFKQAKAKSYVFVLNIVQDQEWDNCIYKRDKEKNKTCTELFSQEVAQTAELLKSPLAVFAFCYLFSSPSYGFLQTEITF